MLQIDELLAAERREGMRRSTRGSLPVEGACDEPGEAEEEVEAGHRPEEKNVREGFGGTVAIYREQRREQRGQAESERREGWRTRVEALDDALDENICRSRVTDREHDDVDASLLDRDIESGVLGR
jgi:hypothetical protein